MAVAEKSVANRLALACSAVKAVATVADAAHPAAVPPAAEMVAAGFSPATVRVPAAAVRLAATPAVMAAWVAMVWVVTRLAPAACLVAERVPR